MAVEESFADVLGPNEIVKLNVGGVKYETLAKTLKTVQDSMLSRLISHESEISKIRQGEELFIDRNGTLFEFILEFLRSPATVKLPHEKFTLERLEVEAEFYLIDDLTSKIRSILLTFPFAVGDMVRLREMVLEIWPKKSDLAFFTSEYSWGMAPVDPRIKDWFERKCSVDRHELLEWRGTILEIEKRMIVVRFTSCFVKLPWFDADSEVDIRVPIGILERIDC